MSLPTTSTPSTAPGGFPRSVGAAIPPGPFIVTAVPNSLAWVTATEYVANQLVTNGGNTYICLIAHESADNFSDDSAFWLQLGGAAPPSPLRWLGFAAGVGSRDDGNPFGQDLGLDLLVPILTTESQADNIQSTASSTIGYSTPGGAAVVHLTVNAIGLQPGDSIPLDDIFGFAMFAVWAVGGVNWASITLAVPPPLTYDSPTYEFVEADLTITQQSGSDFSLGTVDSFGAILSAGGGPFQCGAYFTTPTDAVLTS